MQDIQQNLLSAVQEGDLAWTRELLDAGADPNFCDTTDDTFYGTTPLFWAAERANSVQLLIEYGATVDAERPSDGHTSLHVAAEAGSLDSLKLLMPAGGRRVLNAFDDMAHTPLMCATANGHLECVRFLVQEGCDVNAQDENRIGNTAIQEAVEAGNLAIIRILLDAGADPQRPGWMGCNAVDVARNRGDELGECMAQILTATPSRPE